MYNAEQKQCTNNTAKNAQHCLICHFYWCNNLFSHTNINKIYIQIFKKYKYIIKAFLGIQI